MPKQIFQIKDFSGGLNTLKDPADIANNELQDIENLRVDKQGSISAAYINTDSTNNKVSAYNSSHISTIEAGYGLGYLETDHVRDPVTVSQTSSIAGDDDNEGSAYGFIARQVGGEYKELEYRSNGTQQNLASSFPIGTQVLLTSTTFTADGLSPESQGVYTVVDTNGSNIIFDKALSINIETAPQDFWGATLKGTAYGDQVILLANPAEHKIDTYSVNTAGTNWQEDSITLRSDASGTNSKVKYYTVEDAIRCCDTADKNNSKIQWYGWIQRRHFEKTAAASSWKGDTGDNSYLAYYAKDNTLAKPTQGHVKSSTGTAGVLVKYKSSDGATYDSLDAGTGFNVAITTETDVDGLISSGIYELAQTFVYDGNQESLPTVYTDTHTITESDDLKVLSLCIGTVGPFDPRISGGRIYIRKQDTDEEWVMLVDIDLTKGCRTKFTDDHSVWDNGIFTPTGTTGNSSTSITSVSDVTYLVDGMTITGGNIEAGTTIASHNGSNVITLSQNTASSGGGSTTLTISGGVYSCPDFNHAANNFIVKQLGAITYELINGFSSNIFSHAIGDSGEYWKDVVVANNRAFVCNVNIKDENTGLTKEGSTTTHFPDRIMYSMPHRYDTFPYHNFIEAAKGDADSYTAIDSYGDRLLAFKRYSLDIINIANPDDTSWFLEESRKYMGVGNPEAVKRTQYGVLWINQQGIYLYNGQQIQNLSENKLSPSTISGLVTTSTGIIYDELESLAYIIKSLSGAASGITVDLKRGTFVTTTDFVSVANDGNTNPVDTDNNILIANDSGSSVDFYKLYRTVAANTCEFETKEYDFGDPSTTKKVYAVYVTYKSDNALTGYFTLQEDDGSSHALSGTIASSATNWATVKLTPSSPVVCNKIAVKMDTSSNNRKVYINDIGIEYRMLKKRAG